MAFDSLKTFYRTARHGLPFLRIKPDSSFSVADKIEDRAASRGSHPFVLFEGQSVSYAESNEAANRVAHWALAQGLTAGDVVALLMQNRPEYLSTWGGLAKIGVTTALINTNLSGKALAHAIDAAGTRKLLIGSECMSLFESLGADARAGLQTFLMQDSANRVQSPAGIEDISPALDAQPATNPDRSHRAGVTAGDPLVFIYTSGTTGLPKAAKMSHLRFTMTGLVSLIAGFGPRDVMYCALPLYHSAGGAMAVMTVINSGGTLALRRRFSASHFWEDVRDMEATAFQYIGEFCRYLLNQPDHAQDASHKLKFAIGNGLRPDIWPDFQSRFALPKVVEFYGATEGNVAITNFEGKVGSVGKPPPIVPAPLLVRYDVENDEHIRGDDGLCIECKPDEVGEMLGEIPADSNTAQGRFEGYTSKEATEKKILRDVKKQGDTFFRTGDLLKCDAAGYFYFIDRIGDTFRWKGENVSTQEVAEAVGIYPGVEMVNVYGVEVAGTDGRAGMAAMILADSSTFDGAALYKLATDQLPAYARPVFVRLQPQAEVTGTFKLRKVELQREGYDPVTVSDPLFVRDDAAQTYKPLTTLEGLEVR